MSEKESRREIGRGRGERECKREIGRVRGGETGHEVEGIKMNWEECKECGMKLREGGRDCVGESGGK